MNSFDGRIKANAAIVSAGTSGAVSIYASNTTDVLLDVNGYFVAATSPGNLSFYPVAPCRIADTRNAAGPFGGPSMTAGQTRSFAIPSASCGIPGTAQAYSLNMTVVPPGALAFLTTWATGQAQPGVSTLNAYTGTVTANAAIVPAGTSGAINVYVTNPTDVLIDINGYFAPPGSPGELLFNPVTPCRILDTRNPTGIFGGPSMAAGETRSFPVQSSSCGLPSTAQAYSLSATVIPNSVLAFLTLWPTGQSRPFVSTLNAFDGSITSNAALVPAGTGGSVSAYVYNLTDLLLDVNGYFSAPAGGSPPPSISCAASPNPATQNQTVTFSSQASGGSPPYTYTWSNAVTGSGVNASFQPQGTGTYKADLLVRDSLNQTAATSCSVQVQPASAYDCSGEAHYGSQLFLLDTGYIFATFSARIDNTPTANLGDWRSQVRAATLATPLAGTLGPQDALQTTGSNPSTIDLPNPPGALSQLGFGNYTTQARYVYTNSHCSPTDFIFSEQYNVVRPAISGLSPNYGVLGTVVSNVVISGSGLNSYNGQQYLGVTDVQVTQSGQPAQGIVATLISQGNNTATVRLDLTASTVRAGAYNVSLVAFGVTTNALSFTVADVTPQITSINQLSTLNPNGQAYIEIYGNHFGSSQGTLAICASGATPCGSSDVSGSITYWSDIQVNAQLTAGASAAGTYDVELTSRGSSGSGFQAPPQGQTSSQSNRKQVQVSVLVSMKLERVSTVISTDGRYSEDTTIRVTAVNSGTGTPLTNFTGTINIAEDGTSIYIQNGGTLPSSVTITSGGTVTFVAKSLADPSATGVAGAKPADARIKTTNYAVLDGSLAIPQWIISGTQIDSHASGQVYDWVQARTRDIFSSATGDVATVLSAVSSYSIAALATGGVTNWQRAAQSPIVINPYYSYSRLDAPTGNICDQTITKWFTATLFHEARHAYQASLSVSYDADGDFSRKYYCYRSHDYFPRHNYC